jgi:hypothetical protein
MASWQTHSPEGYGEEMKFDRNEWALPGLPLATCTTITMSTSTPPAYRERTPFPSYPERNSRRGGGLPGFQPAVIDPLEVFK